MIQGETVHSGAPLPYVGAEPEAMSSAAGWYVGYRDKDGGPYSRETNYLKSKEVAERVLAQVK